MSQLIENEDERVRPDPYLTVHYIKKGRKDHTCLYCGTTIPRGARHLQVVVRGYEQSLSPRTGRFHSRQCFARLVTPDAIAKGVTITKWFRTWKIPRRKTKGIEFKGREAKKFMVRDGFRLFPVHKGDEKPFMSAEP